MFYRLIVSTVCFSIILITVSACQNTPKATTPTMEEVKSRVVEKVKATSQIAPGIDLDNEPIKPLIAPTDLNSQKVELGKALYHDVRLSKDNSLSCASCHGLDKGGVDGTPVSVGVGGVQGPINSPTVYNSGFNSVQFWDGRAKDLKEQAGGPVLNPKEMAATWESVLAKLNADEGFKQKFLQTYSDGFSADNITDAIAEFERSLVTVNSRFDQYLSGNKNALSAQELNGYELFKGYGCVTCHNGANVGGNSFQKFGLINDYFATKKEITEADLGRFNVTKDPNDKHKFKVPSLRVAAFTAPYFHDASAATLEDAVKIMGKMQLNIDFSADEIADIVAFIKSLAGEYNGKSLAEQTLSQ